MERLEDNACVVLLSGGLDSTTLLGHAKQTQAEVVAVGFNYGQRHVKELTQAQQIAQHYEVQFLEIEMGFMSRLLKSALTTRDIEVPEGHYTDESMKATIVPMRNAIMLSIACGIALSRGARRVLTAVHAGDHPIYPDCRPEFIYSFEEMARTGTDSDIIIEAPFLRMEKSDIVMFGTRIGVPYDLTWSCYQGRELHCGKCGTCVERKEAFEVANVFDPTVYNA